MKVIRLSKGLLGEVLQSEGILRVDRVTVLGNPFPLDRSSSSRSRVIQAYSKYLWTILKSAAYGWEVDLPNLTQEVAKEFDVSVIKKFKFNCNGITLQEILLAYKQLVESFDEISLGCWCKPERCHGDILVSSRNWYLAQKDDISVRLKDRLSKLS
jgi:hypothetical protein